jgi:hypothetical protein
MNEIFRIVGDIFRTELLYDPALPAPPPDRDRRTQNQPWYRKEKSYMLPDTWPRLWTVSEGNSYILPDAYNLKTSKQRAEFEPGKSSHRCPQYASMICAVAFSIRTKPILSN